jgi:hypothetical protein
MTVLSWHRRQAVQIVGALPENIEDALIVLALATELTAGFLAGQPLQPDLVLERERGNVVSLSSATNGSSR